MSNDQALIRKLQRLHRDGRKSGAARDDLWDLLSQNLPLILRLAAKGSKRDQWKPIATMPKGKEVLQFCIYTDEEPGFIATKMVVEDEPYRCAYHATHWQPLPKRPTRLISS